MSETEGYDDDTLPPVEDGNDYDSDTMEETGIGTDGSFVTGDMEEVDPENPIAPSDN